LDNQEFIYTPRGIYAGFSTTSLEVMKTQYKANYGMESHSLQVSLIDGCWQATVQCSLRAISVLCYRVIYVSFMFCILVSVSACTDDNNEYPSNILELNSSQSQVCRKSFTIKKLSLTHIEGSSVLFQLTADSVIDRPRTGKMAFFKNYYEIYLQNTVLDQPLKESVLKLDLKGIIKAVRKFDDENNPGKKIKEVMPDFSGCSLSRVLVDDIKINIKPAKRLPIVLIAGHAKMGADANIIKFEQNVNLTANKCKLSSQSAVWSDKFNGLFLPEIYTINGKKRAAGDFFKITQDGRCLRVRPAPVVEYLDMLEDVEDNLFNHVPLNGQMRWFLNL
jgi:hypothetical protein